MGAVPDAVAAGLSRSERAGCGADTQEPTC